jgi:hypothetical protein
MSAHPCSIKSSGSSDPRVSSHRLRDRPTLLRMGGFIPLCRTESVRHLRKRFRTTWVLLSPLEFASRVKQSSSVAVIPGRTSSDSIRGGASLFLAKAGSRAARKVPYRKQKKRFWDSISQKLSQFLSTARRNRKCNSGPTVSHRPPLGRHGIGLHKPSS